MKHTIEQLEKRVGARAKRWLAKTPEADRTKTGLTRHLVCHGYSNDLVTACVQAFGFTITPAVVSNLRGVAKRESPPGTIRGQQAAVEEEALFLGMRTKAYRAMLTQPRSRTRWELLRGVRQS